MAGHYSDGMSSDARNSTRKRKRLSAGPGVNIPNSHTKVLDLQTAAEIVAWFTAPETPNFDHTHTHSWKDSDWEQYSKIFSKLFNRNLTVIGKLSGEFFSRKIPATESWRKHTRDPAWVDQMSQELADDLILERFGNYDYDDVAIPFLREFLRNGYLSILVKRYKEKLAKRGAERKEPSEDPSTNRMDRHAQKELSHASSYEMSSPNQMSFIQTPYMMESESNNPIYTPSPRNPNNTFSAFGMGYGYNDRHKPIGDNYQQIHTLTSFPGEPGVTNGALTSPFSAQEPSPLQTHTYHHEDSFAATTPVSSSFGFPLIDRLLLVHFPSVDSDDFYAPVAVAALIKEAFSTVLIGDLQPGMVSIDQLKLCVQGFIAFTKNHAVLSQMQHMPGNVWQQTLEQTSQCIFYHDRDDMGSTVDDELLAELMTSQHEDLNLSQDSRGVLHVYCTYPCWQGLGDAAGGEI